MIPWDPKSDPEIQTRFWDQESDLTFFQKRFFVRWSGPLLWFRKSKISGPSGSRTSFRFGPDSGITFLIPYKSDPTWDRFSDRFLIPWEIENVWPIRGQALGQSQAICRHIAATAYEPLRPRKRHVFAQPCCQRRRFA